MEGDAVGLGSRLGRGLLDVLRQLGATFVTGYIVPLGFHENEGHLVHVIDERPYASAD